MKNTQDLSEFGYIEKQEAGRLLLALGTTTDKTRFLGEGVRVEFNPSSGNVFLVDDDCNVAMLNGENLEDFFSCPQCGHEGFLADMEHDFQPELKEESECLQYLLQIKGR